MSDLSLTLPLNGSSLWYRYVVKVLGFNKSMGFDKLYVVKISLIIEGCIPNMNRRSQGTFEGHASAKLLLNGLCISQGYVVIILDYNWTLCSKNYNWISCIYWKFCGENCTELDDLLPHVILLRTSRSTEEEFVTALELKYYCSRW